MKFHSSLAIAAAVACASLSAQAATIYNNGPVVGSNGYSVIDAGATTYGLGMNTAAAVSVADNFSVAAGTTWTVESINFYAYQTNATAFTFTNATWSVVSGDVNTGTVVASGTTALTNAGIVGYRVTGTSTDTARTIYSANANMADFSLAAGSYWLRWSLAGSASFTGPWQPPTADGVQGNAQQSLSGAAYALATDATTGVSFELPFTVNGTISAVPEPSTTLMLLSGAFALVGVARRRREN